MDFSLLDLGFCLTDFFPELTQPTSLFLCRNLLEFTRVQPYSVAARALINENFCKAPLLERRTALGAAHGIGLGKVSLFFFFLFRLEFVDQFFFFLDKILVLESLFSFIPLACHLWTPYRGVRARLFLTFFALHFNILQSELSMESRTRFEVVPLSANLEAQYSLANRPQKRYELSKSLGEVPMAQIGFSFVNPAPQIEPGHVAGFARKCEEIGAHSCWVLDRIAYDNLEPLIVLAV